MTQLPPSLEAQLGMKDAPREQEEELTQAAYEQSQVFELARTSLNFMAALAAPALMKFLFPTIFLQIWNLLVSAVHKTRDFSKLAIGLPRGFGKTTFIKFFILYCILFTSRRYIIVISATEKHAINIITDVCTFLSNPNIRAVFGD